MKFAVMHESAEIPAITRDMTGSFEGSFAEAVNVLVPIALVKIRFSVNKESSAENNGIIHHPFSKKLLCAMHTISPVQ